MQIELCSFYISREQAENLLRSFSVIKSSQQRLSLIFEEYKKIRTGAIDPCLTNLHLVSFLENHYTNDFVSLTAGDDRSQPLVRFYLRPE